MSRSLEGKVALVTGAAQGLGRAYAQRLAQDGADLVLVDLSPDTAATEALVRAAGRQVFSVATDVSQPDQVAHLAEAANKQFGRVDIVVNNAGIYPFESLADMTFENWRQVLAINLDSVFLMSKAFFPGMKDRKWGRLINISSTSAWMVAPNSGHYIVSKLGVVGLTRALATELAEFGITANAVAPGLIHTPGTDGGPAADFFAELPNGQAIKRAGTPPDLVGIISFLASDDAAFITGQTLAVDGGMVRL